jgi:hypothetical protein
MRAQAIEQTGGKADRIGCSNKLQEKGVEADRPVVDRNLEILDEKRARPQ